MDNPSPPPGQHAPASNGAGITGFILSLLGLVSCGLLAPFGLIFSLVGLRKEPKGLAIAGTVIGAIAICGWAIPVALFGTMFFGLILALTGLSTPEFEVRFELAYITQQLDTYQTQHGSYPQSISNLQFPIADWRVDPWGNEYVYEVDPSGAGYTLFSKGEDGVAGTQDDILP